MEFTWALAAFGGVLVLNTMQGIVVAIARDRGSFGVFRRARVSVSMGGFIPLQSHRASQALKYRPGSDAPSHGDCSNVGDRGVHCGGPAGEYTDVEIVSKMLAPNEYEA